MKDFKELNDTRINNTVDGIKDFKELIKNESESIFESESVKDMSDEEIQEAVKAYKALAEHLDNGGTLENIDEAILGSVLGGVTGALVGPALGKAICKALGITKGIMYDLLTSRLVTTALGATIFGRK